MSWEPPEPSLPSSPNVEGSGGSCEWTPSQIATSFGALIIVGTVCALVLHWAGVI